MYKLLLCLRYLRTRYIALASIISVTLGVATMIVVNAVLAGWSHEMQARIQGFLSDLSLESHSLDGFPDPQWHMEQIRRVAGEDIAGLTATVYVPAMLSMPVSGQWVTRQVDLVGIDEDSIGAVSDFGRYLQHPANRRRPSFLLREGGYDALDRQGEVTVIREEMKRAGWEWRRLNAQKRRWAEASRERSAQGVATPAAEEPAEGLPGAARSPSPRPDAAAAAAVVDDAALGASDIVGDGGARHPFQQRQWNPEGDAGNVFDPARQQHTGIILGIALATFRTKDLDGQVKDGFLLRPGDDVQLTFPTAGTPPKGGWDTFTVVDFYESKMYEYDSRVVLVPMKKLQELRGMIDPATGVRFVNSIRIKLKRGRDAGLVRDKLRGATIDGQPAFPPALYAIATWRDKQGPILQAVELETATLNILLFLIIAVAGFGILATFFMIVVEKTKDIGILKSLGAPSTGVMGIFVSYGLSLGCVGAGGGLALGLVFVRYINEIRQAVEWLTGRKVFDPTIYYFHEIPTIINPVTVGWVLAGAVAIAVVASVLPALRAALLHPVEALRN